MLGIGHFVPKASRPVKGCIGCAFPLTRRPMGATLSRKGRG
jgi:hypothetical protein